MFIEVVNAAELEVISIMLHCFELHATLANLSTENILSCFFRMVISLSTMLVKKGS